MNKLRQKTAAALAFPFFADRRWIYLIPLIGMIWIWASSLSFVPVPWPDDSAFYFPAKDLFSWPPRWVMIPQAPFEPSYREWNFNTMPLFPILIGVARLIGITGTHALKFLPLGGWFLGIFFAVHSFRRAGASAAFLISAALVLTLDPILRWSSVLIRPESLIAAMGMCILFGFRFGWPDFFRERKYFHPVSLCLLIGALLHFNAIHLLPLVIVLYAQEFRKLLKIAVLTGVGLIPWILTIAYKPALFAEQMELQFSRLAGFHNPWLSTWTYFTKSLLMEMGTPEPWPGEFQIAILGCLVALPVLFAALVFLIWRKKGQERVALLGAFAWLTSALYLWHTKAEVWFTHYFHLAFWALALLILFEFQKLFRSRMVSALTLGFPVIVGLLFLYGQIDQTLRLESTQTWHWDTYDRWIECIDSFLTEEYEKRGRPEVFRVWDPTFPDITIALSQKHPTWEFTRTNDFRQRWDLGVKHGYEVEAMVITEIFRLNEVEFKGPLDSRPQNQSVWMHWQSYFLNRLERDPKFKPKRSLCQTGRWDAFIYMND